jgi:hypothetical protein
MGTRTIPVHFDTVAKAVTGYEKNDIAAFGLFNGEQLITKYQGDDLNDGKQILKWWLNSFVNDERAAIYTVRLFEEVPVNGIKNNTPYDGSFNCRFFRHTSGFLPEPLHQFAGGGMNALMDKLTDMQSEIKLLKEKVDEEPAAPEAESVDGSIGAVILRQVEPLLPAVMAKLVEWIPVPKGATHLAGIMHDSNISQDADIRIAAAVDVLKEKVTDLAPLMEKLALMATKQPTAFDVYKKMLLAMRIV